MRIALSRYPYVLLTALAVATGGLVGWRPSLGLGACVALLTVGALALPLGRPVVTAAAVLLSVGSAASLLLPDFAGMQVTSWVFLFLAATGLAARSFQSQSWRQHFTGTEWGSLLLLTAGLAAVGSAADSASSIAGALTIAQHICILVAIASMPPRLQSVRWVLGGLFGGMLVQVAVGLAELAIGRTLFYSMWKPIEAATWGGIMRIASTPADPNYFALGLVSTLGLIAVIRVTWTRVPRGILLSGAALWLVMIAFTFSRAGYAGLLLTTALTIAGFGGRKRWVLLGTVAILAASAWFLFPEALAPFTGRFRSIATSGDASIIMRVSAQRAAIQAFLDHPVLGIGLGQFVHAGPEYLYALSGIAITEVNTLNSYLLVASETGIVGLLGLLVALGWTLFKLRSTAIRLRGSSAREDRAIAAVSKYLALCLVVWSLVSLTLDGIHSPIQWVFLGLGALIARYQPQNRAVEIRP